VLGQLIHGWRRTLPVIKAGGFITLYVPPSMAYGAAITRDGNGNVIIPANAYLKFDIDLLTVQ
jgi:FKBP-type peptidyl-prolyl cis-trans isomerase FkpA